MEKPKFITKECKHHGVTEYVLESRGYYRCKKCRVEKVIRRRQKVRKILIDEFGGKCSQCDYNKSLWALEFHHLEDSSKDFGLSQKGLTRSIEGLRKEAAKCILVCANCHREIHAGERQLK